MTVASLYDSPLTAASSMLGASERGPGAAALNDFLTTGGQNLDPATTAWCAAFVNASLGAAGQQGTGALNARSFLDWGQAVDQPQRGDVAVFSRGDPNGWQGHVGFFEGYGPDGRVRVLGGNQGDSVSVASFDPSSLLGFRRGAATPGFNPNAPAPAAGLADLFVPPRKAPQRAAQVDKAAAEKQRRAALFETLPGLYG